MWPTDVEISKPDNEWGHKTLFSDNQRKLKPAGLVLLTSYEVYEDRRRTLEERFLSPERPTENQIDDHENHMPMNYKEYKEKLDQEENMEYKNYQDDLDSHDCIYESDYELDDEEVYNALRV